VDPMKDAVEAQRAAHAKMIAAADALDELRTNTDGTDEDRSARRDAEQKNLDDAEADYTRHSAEIKSLEQIAHSRSLVPRDPVAAPASPRVSVGAEARTYRRDGEFSYFRDLARVREGDSEARDRLIGNNRQYDELMQERAGINQTATTGGEFVPPVWYVEQYAALLRAGRPFLNALGTKPLPPDTNSLNFPKITTGSTVAVQSDGGSVSNTDLVTTSVTAQVQTEAGRSVASYQFVDLSPVADQVIMQDLLYAYNTQEDKDILASSNVTNAKSVLNTASVNSVTYTDATPTGAEFFQPVAQSASAIAKGAFVGVDLLVTHPSIWYNILSGLDSQSRPLYLTVGPGNNLMGDGDYQQGNGLVGNIGGIPLAIDANMPTNLGGGTNESRLVALNRMGFDVWESAPRFKVADQTSITTLQYQFVAYGYWAACSRQPKMISIVSGTGMIPVSGF